MISTARATESRRTIARVFLACALAVALGLSSAAAASATTVFSENWESGSLGKWTLSPGATNFWGVINHPELISVKSPEINPTLVTLPDSGALPSANGGTHVAWFGDPESGTFCLGYTLGPQSDKNGCTSYDDAGNATPVSGELISPPFSLSSASSAILRFAAWFEIEGVAATGFDKMSVSYSTDGGSTWNDLGTLNPASNPSGTPDQSYSNNGLGQSPSWKTYLVDLTPAAGNPNPVQIKFTFDSVDELYQGFRGWLIDDVNVSAPYDAVDPSISSVETCLGQQDAPVTVIHGSNFVVGSNVMIDGQPIETANPAPDRIEIPAVSSGSHTAQVQSPNGTLSNTFSFTAGGCAPPPQPPPSNPPPVTPVVPPFIPNLGPPPPVLGRAVNAFTESGTVLVKLPPGFKKSRDRWMAKAAAGFIPLSKLGRQIPVGSTLDTSKGKVHLLSATNKSGGTQDGHFNGGLFIVQQKGTNPLTTLAMTGGGLNSCSKLPRGGSAKAIAARRRGRRLFSNVHGRFRTTGRNSSATVRGTEFLVKDTCSGTLTQVKRGVVTVRDFALRKNVTVKAGHKYLARAPKRHKHKR